MRKDVIAKRRDPICDEFVGQASARLGQLDPDAVALDFFGYHLVSA